MVVTVFGIVTDVSLAHPPNALSPITVTPVGITIDNILLFKKAKFGIVVIVVGRVTERPLGEVRLVPAFLKAATPMVVMLVGTITASK